ncbi:hypothetical protein [Halobacillus sp. BBL2006]|uniref:hypothetical protein n=1 Tax=Halobacillus sp. BBL2006 TaxID=1543706 RepID=UPI0005442F98|nr:hypothetical protein [Halobacillus sp. BBL2006]KHE72786.1 hypothetical protein LD39_02730 [Halobacillus sp. BBL2006]
MNNRGRSTSLLVAGAVGAAAMYGITRMNRNGGFRQLAQRARNNQAMENMRDNLPNMGNTDL